MLETILHHCNTSTQLCIAVEITGANEYIKTKTIADWKKETIDLHKKPVIFLLMG
jgi:16S rRNA (cytidine1402-2'-O)-methyltransferase